MLRFRVVGGLIVGLTLLAGLALGAFLYQSLVGDSDPLGGRTYALQHVLSRVDGEPAVRAGEAVRIRGVLCSSETTPVWTTLGWRPYRDGVELTGSFVTVGVDIEQIREQGCHEFTFVNPQPVSVTETNSVLLGEGGDITWRVTGFEVPHDSQQQTTGLRKTFRSQPFRIIP